MSDYASEGGHWYEPSGKTAYEYLAKDGTMKPTTLREARRYGWYPSVSGVNDILAQPARERWKRMKDLEMACSVQQGLEEGQQAYINRVMALGQEKRNKVRDLGSHIHGCIECHLTGRDYDQNYSTHVMGAVAAVDSWCGLGGISAEKSFAHPLGYGGKCDLHKQVMERTLPFYGDWVLDFKTTEFSEGDLPRLWDNHASQLAPYRHGLKMPNARCAIIFVSTSVPGLTHTIEIPEKYLCWGWDLFCATLEVWKIVKKYDPCKQMELV